MVRYYRDKKGARKVGFLPRKAAKKAADAKSLSRPEKREVARMIRGAGETKMVAWYSGGSNPLGVGARTGWAWEPQNGLIADNTTDIKRLIPLVTTGVGDNQRIGDRINPISLIVHGNVALNFTNVLYQQAPRSLYVVIYVLQHVSLKTYASLQNTYNNATPPVVVAGNNFNQLLLTGEGNTVGFNGLAYEADLPVATEFYKLLTKRIIPLRASGIVLAPTGASAGPSLQSINNNSTSYCARYTLNLSKHLPKQLKYEETTSTSATVGDPTNSSIFMCMGFYDWEQYSSGSSAAAISNEYVSLMKYKDL